MIDVRKFFNTVDSSEMGKFERVTTRFSQRPDLNAFILLDKLVPCTANNSVDLVTVARNDEILLNVKVDELALTATEDDLLTLYRCGVDFEEDYDCLRLFI